MFECWWHENQGLWQKHEETSKQFISSHWTLYLNTMCSCERRQSLYHTGERACACVRVCVCVCVCLMLWTAEGLLSLPLYVKWLTSSYGVDVSGRSASSKQKRNPVDISSWIHILHLVLWHFTVVLSKCCWCIYYVWRTAAGTERFFCLIWDRVQMISGKQVFLKRLR